MRRLSSTIRLGLGFALVCILGFPMMIVCLFLLPWRALRVKVCNVYGMIVGKISLRYIMGNPTVIRNRERIDRHRPAIYILNHNSYLDGFLSMWICPLGGCGIGKKELGRIPVFGWLYHLSGHLLIDRGDREKAIASMKETTDFVAANGLSIWIFPEGTRSYDGRLLPFKKGFAHMAIATGLPVVPVITHNVHKVWPRSSYLLTPGPLEIDVLEPIDTSAWKTETIAEHIEATRQVFLGALWPDQLPEPS
jgi:1-acyl-sn-glycerol-3-phosphate acyltransferase